MKNFQNYILYINKKYYRAVQTHFYAPNYSDQVGKKTGAQNQSTRLIEEQLEICFFSFYLYTG